MSEHKSIKLRLRDLLKLKRYARKHDLSDMDALGFAIKNLDVKKLATEEPKTKEIELSICDECDAEIQSDASFCPYCGVEFDEDDEDDDDDEDEDDDDEEDD